MIKRLALIACLGGLCAGPALAQVETIEVETLEETLDIILGELNADGAVTDELGNVETHVQESVRPGSGAVLRGLDKVAGSIADMRLANGESAELGWLFVTLGQCRYPADNPSGDAYAWVSIRDLRDDSVLFEGWMVASSPALNALDHPRYDVWVLRCTTE